MTVVAALTLASCSPTPAPPTRYAALLVGKLVIVDNCLRVNPEHSNESNLLIWPPEFDVRIDNGTVYISDRLTAQKAIWHIGEIVRLGGGAAYGIHDGERPLFSNNCPGPYWIVGGIVVPPTVTPAVK